MKGDILVAGHIAQSFHAEAGTLKTESSLMTASDNTVPLQSRCETENAVM